MDVFLASFLLIISTICDAYPDPEASKLTFRRPKQFRRTFHVETSSNVQIDEASPDTKLKICPNYKKGVFDVELFDPEIVDNTVCKLVYNEIELETNSVEYICKWSGLQLTTGQWYHFKAWITSGGTFKRVSNSWDAVEPAFDVDEFGINVVSKETSLEINLDAETTAHLWNALIGEKGLLIFTLIEGETKITKTVSKVDKNMKSPMVAFTGLKPHKCYTVEAYTTMDNIASYNRTWFDVRTGDAGFTLSADEIRSNTARISIKSSKLDASCKVILTILCENTESDDLPRYQYMENQTTITVGDLLPMHKYVIRGSSECGSTSSPNSSNDLCETAGGGTTEVSFETYPDVKKLK